MAAKKPVTLKKNKEFGYVYRRGARLNFYNFTLVYVKGKYGGVRVGFSVNKKVGNSVQRNKVRRRLKEAYRMFLPQTSGNYSLIFVASEKITGSAYSQIARDMQKALIKAHVIKGTSYEESRPNNAALL